MFALDSGDTHDVQIPSPQSEVVPEPIEPISTPQPEFTPEKSTPHPFPNPSAEQKTYINSIGIEFVLIPVGSFDMGSPSGEIDRVSAEGPVHKVIIPDGFYLGKYEVTQKQWREVMGNNPSHFKGDDRPVEMVPWNDVQEFIKKLNQKEGTDKYRLPSEAEWEYAARAGTTTRYSFGDDESRLGEYAWYTGNSGRQTHPVGQKKPNPWGLYDMHGNVYEWIQDRWHGDYNGAPTNGSAWESGGGYRVYRGCSWNYNKDNCRSAKRHNLDPRNFHDTHGFRLLMEQ
ncbi:MAG: formylglycine-generating enzyme family protein [Methanosarcinales archaeon]|nr:formylglycine-generating enzyme family protein [Methanosarcinales archaeon]